MTRSQTESADHDTLTIRSLAAAERPEVERLAARDSRPVPVQPLLGIEAGGRLLAVTSLATGDTVADPFLPTAEARAMLELRATQLRRADGRRRGFALRVPGTARASLAGSPPGAARRLLTLGG